ncbi:MAG: fluoride efflux transporter CrcB [Vibrionaceae bacterium]
MDKWSSFLFVGMGGALGAISRYFVGEICAQLFGRSFPIATLIVNVIGSFLIGSTLACGRYEWLSQELRLFISIGFLGALTTFSTFSADNFLLLQQGEFIKFLLNFFLNTLLCLAAVALGFQFLVNIKG